MTGWRAVVPVKLGPDAKSRLGGLLSLAQRSALVERMARHVLAELAATERFATIAVLSADRPDWWTGGWAADRGRGLNAELEAWRAEQDAAPVLVIHADLPFLTRRDVAELLAAAGTHGAALATDRAGEGSNALAIADGRAFQFRFGPSSRKAHCEQAPAMPVLTIASLATDLDTPTDAAFLGAQGFAL